MTYLLGTNSLDKVHMTLIAITAYTSIGCQNFIYTVYEYIPGLSAYTSIGCQNFIYTVYEYIPGLRFAILR